MSAVWFENFQKQMGLHNIEFLGKSASADHLADAKYPEHCMKVIKEKDY
jgi:hypothetical protein